MRKIFVAGHRRADGKYVKPHWRTVPGAEPRATTMPAFAPQYTLRRQESAPYTPQRRLGAYCAQPNRQRNR